MKQIYELFSNLIKKFPFYFLLLVFLVFGQAFINALSVLSIAPVVDFMLDNPDDKKIFITKIYENLSNYLGFELQLSHLFIFYALITFVNAILAIYIQYLLLKIKYDVVIYLLTETIEQFFKSKLAFFNKGNMGVLLNSFQNEISKIGDSFGNISNIIANILQMLIFLILPLSLSPMITIIFLILTLLITSPVWFIRKSIYSLGKKNLKTANRMTSILHEALSAAKLILSFASQKEVVKLYKSSIVKHAEVSILFQLLSRSVMLLSFPLAIIAALISIYIAFGNNVPLSELVMVLFALTRLVPIFGTIFQAKTTIEGFVPAYEQVEKLKELARNNIEITSGNKFKNYSNSIKLENISFAHEDRDFNLKNINMEFKKGFKTAIVGRSGSGKTTIMDLILGLYKPDKGEIFIDDKNIKSFDINSFRKNIGYVPQEPQLFNASVMENILWAYPKASKEDVYKACKLANASEFIDQLPNKYDTILGERGVLISGGQRQRLSLARSLIKNPKLLFLDEVTSSLDSLSEKLIHNSLNELSSEGLTIVFITHHASLLKHSDYIYFIDSGNVESEGRFEDLIKKNEKFQRLFE